MRMKLFEGKKIQYQVEWGRATNNKKSNCETHTFFVDGEKKYEERIYDTTHKIKIS